MYSADSSILGFIFSLGIQATITININKSRKQVMNKAGYFNLLTNFDFMTLLSNETNAAYPTRVRSVQFTLYAYSYKSESTYKFNYKLVSVHSSASYQKDASTENKDCTDYVEDRGTDATSARKLCSLIICHCRFYFQFSCQVICASGLNCNISISSLVIAIRYCGLN